MDKYGSGGCEWQMGSRYDAARLVGVFKLYYICICVYIYIYNFLLFVHFTKNVALRI